MMMPDTVIWVATINGGIVPERIWLQTPAIGFFDGPSSWPACFHQTEADDVEYVLREALENLETEFRKLVDQWREETGHVSSTTDLVLHPAYQQIVGMGKDALPFLFGELRKDNDFHWFWALRAITREGPATTPKAYYDPQKAVEAWLRWGEEHGYIS